MRRVDPAGRQLSVGLGAALLGMRIGAAASGVAVTVRRWSDPLDPDLAALVGTVPDTVDDRLAALDPVVELRHTPRGPLSTEPWPPELTAALADAAAACGAALTPVPGPLGPVLAEWTATAAALEGPDRLREDPALCTRARLAALSTDGDGPEDWLRAGEALHRVLLETTRHGYEGGLVTRLTEVPELRHRAAELLCPGRHLQALVRVGRGAPTAGPGPRRRLDSVLLDHAPTREPR